MHDMNDTEPTRLRCDGIQYRGGFIETRLVHAKHINLETWSIDPDALNSNAKWVTDVSDSAVTGNVELELDLRTAMDLTESLHELVAIESAANGTETNCDECGSRFLSSQATMSALCPECSHYLYNKPNCAHSFRDGRCRRCGWDGSVSEYVATIKGTTKSG
jgi:DNA-directed RNA polymerase subunit RPC12/RpoP